MTIDDIKEILYTYYPKNATWNDGYYLSNEYHCRKRTIGDALNDKEKNAKWTLFKSEITDLIIAKSVRLGDYSFGGGGASFHLSVNPKVFSGGFENTIVFSVVISVLADVWSFRFLDVKDDQFISRYKTISKEEEELVDKVKKIVLDVFPSYTLLPEDIAATRCNDVYSESGVESPTVFQLLFTDMDN